MNYQDVLNQLSKLDLSSYPVGNIQGLIRELTNYGIMQTTLHAENYLLRGRININNEEFNNISQLSYKPQEYNETYMRASTPYKTMFYGVLMPEKRIEGEIPTERITIAFELSKLIRGLDTEGEIKITYSIWKVVQDIKLFSLIHHLTFKKPSQYIVGLQNQYAKFIDQYPNEVKKSNDIVGFLSNEFAKREINYDYDYLISAIFSEMVTNSFDGVLYPSVRIEGESVNIAIKPNIADSNLILKAAGECSVYKKGENIFIGNDRIGIINSDGTIKYEKAPDDIFVPRELCRKFVGLE